LLVVVNLQATLPFDLQARPISAVGESEWRLCFTTEASGYDGTRTNLYQAGTTYARRTPGAVVFESGAASPPLLLAPPIFNAGNPDGIDSKREAVNGSLLLFFVRFRTFKFPGTFRSGFVSVISGRVSGNRMAGPAFIVFGAFRFLPGGSCLAGLQKSVP
jgi:hypothetical protein